VRVWYLGFFVETCGSVMIDVQDKLLEFSELCIWLWKSFIINLDYSSMVLGVLLYRAESWTDYQED